MNTISHSFKSYIENRDLYETLLNAVDENGDDFGYDFFIGCMERYNVYYDWKEILYQHNMNLDDVMVVYKELDNARNLLSVLGKRDIRLMQIPYHCAFKFMDDVIIY